MPLDAMGGGALLPEEPSDPERTEKAMDPTGQPPSHLSSFPPFQLTARPRTGKHAAGRLALTQNPRRARVWRAKLQAQG